MRLDQKKYKIKKNTNIHRNKQPVEEGNVSERLLVTKIEKIKAKDKTLPIRLVLQKLVG